MELSIEEKAKRYDEALEKVTCKYQDHDTPWSDEDIEDIFPELKESEDERVRKALIFHFQGDGYLCNKVGNIPNTDILAWLEKQGEQKPVEDVNGEDYGIDSLWHAHRILEKTLGKVEGYQSDDGILEHECAISAVKKLYEQKPAWSEEDEKYVKALVDYFTGGLSLKHSEEDIVNWLKDLKDRVQPQTTWKPSKEQIEALLKLEEMHVLEHEKNQENAHLYMVVKSIREQLLKLREE